MNRRSHCGERCGVSSENERETYQVTQPARRNEGSAGGSGSEGDTHSGLIPGSGRSPGEGNGCLPQYCGLEKSMDRGAWRGQSHENIFNQKDTCAHVFPAA